jgi:hypothetical protein
VVSINTVASWACLPCKATLILKIRLKPLTPIRFLKCTNSVALHYHIPNIARKTLESFLLFMVPNGESPFQKLKKIEFDENKKTAIYKFTNDQSHKTGAGFDPSLVAECQKNVQYLLEMIENTFPKHYEILKENNQH